MVKPHEPTNVRIPGRHGADLAESRRVAASLAGLIDGDPTPTDAQWQALGEGLLQGDPLADRLVEWMHADGMAATRPGFERALDQGIASVPDAPAPLRDFFAAIDAPPRWLDQALAAEGARACGLSGLTGLRVPRDVALMGGYQSSAINRALVLTGALTGGTRRRLAETTKWWIDCTAPGGMTRSGSGFRSTVRVRVIHAIIRRHLARHADWDSAFFGLPLNQTDLAATYLGFSVVFLLAQRRMGVPISRAEGRAVMHLWRHIGWLMGVDERWLCDDERGGRIALYQNVLAQAPPDESSRALGRALMNEPLERHHARWPLLTAHWERALHLSVSRLFLGRRGMRALGLPRCVLPWYPLLSAPLVFVAHGLQRAFGGRERLARRGRAAQVDYLPTLFGAEPQAIRGVHGPQLAGEAPGSSVPGSNEAVV